MYCTDMTLNDLLIKVNFIRLRKNKLAIKRQTMFTDSLDSKERWVGINYMFTKNNT